MSGGFGWKARIGQLYPSGGLADSEPQAMAPEGVQFVTTRLTFKRVGLEHGRGLVRDLESHARLLADAEVKLIVFNCTSASMAVGPGAINRRIEAATGIRSTTTIEAVLAALGAARFRRLGLLTPYTEDVVQAETEFLAAAGHRVTMTRTEPCTTPVQQGLMPAARWIELAEPFAGQDIDALFISCAGIQIAPVLQQIEDRLQRPVVTSNQAVVWHCLRVLGLPDRPKGYGALLAGAFD